MQEILNILVQGILLGGLFAIYAMGLSLVFGVMRIVNIAHGDVMTLAAYLTMLICSQLGINAFLSLPIVALVCALAGWLAQNFLFRFVNRNDPLTPMLVAFGIAIIIQNTLLLVFGADPHKLDIGTVEQMSVEPLPGLYVGVFSLIIFAIAVALILGLQAIIYKTAFGRLVRAVSDSEAKAESVGIQTQVVFRDAFTLVMAIIGIAAVLMAVKSNFDPASGPSRLLTSFEVVVVGGLGNLWGTLAGGIIIGLAQMLGASIDASWQVLTGHIVFLLVLIFRPSGLFPKLEG